ncbi:hypothetical protein HZ326_31907, partial [Fusarium oxysporum f. sp. albedinis]
MATKATTRPISRDIARRTRSLRSACLLMHLTYSSLSILGALHNIRGGFRGAGLAPLDPETVISKLDVQLRAPMPPGEVSQPSTPWVSKTPKTATEAQSQSEYLARRIRSHKSSSPESIIEALKSNTKATRAIMHEVVLLRNEVRNLRDANE